MNRAHSNPSTRPRILFIAEAVSLAHVTRPLVLAKGLDPQQWDVHFACADGYAFCLSELNTETHVVHSIAPATFLARLAAGRPLYTVAELLTYVEDDNRLLKELSPNVVVGDFRLSLAVSARLNGIPYISITNAHWSPFSRIKEFPFPEHPLGAILGVPLASGLFHRVQSLVFASHARPMNRIRLRFGMEPIADLRQLYTDGDWTLYADTPELVPTSDLPSHHKYIGPLLWSPSIPTPSWWNDLPADCPSIYVTLGSTGAVDLLPELVMALSTFDASVMVATAGRLKLDKLPPNVWAADYLPGSDAAARASLVLCSGGSATTYQALSLGTPVVGICSNMDQYLTMQYVETAGAGKKLRAGQATARNVRHAIEEVLHTSSYTEAAQRIQRDFAAHPATKGFLEVLSRAAGIDQDPNLVTRQT